MVHYSTAINTFALLANLKLCLNQFATYALALMVGKHSHRRQRQSKRLTVVGNNADSAEENMADDLTIAFGPQ